MCTVAGLWAFMSMPCAPGKIRKEPRGCPHLPCCLGCMVCVFTYVHLCRNMSLWTCHVGLGRLENNLGTALIFRLFWGRLSWYLALHMPGRVAWEFPGILWFLHLISLQVPGNCRHELYTAVHGLLGSQASCLHSNCVSTEPSSARHYPLSRLSIFTQLNKLNEYLTVRTLWRVKSKPQLVLYTLDIPAFWKYVHNPILRLRT